MKKTLGNPTRVQNTTKCPGKRKDAKGLDMPGKPQRTVDVGESGKGVSVKSPGL